MFDLEDGKYYLTHERRSARGSIRYTNVTATNFSSRSISEKIHHLKKKNMMGSSSQYHKFPLEIEVVVKKFSFEAAPGQKIYVVGDQGAAFDDFI